MEARDAGRRRRRGSASSGRARAAISGKHARPRAPARPLLRGHRRGKTRRVDVGRASLHGPRRRAGERVLRQHPLGRARRPRRPLRRRGAAAGSAAPAAYFIASAARAGRERDRRRSPARSPLDGDETREEEIHTRNLAICNGRFFGSGMKVAPMAKLDDGVLRGGRSRRRLEAEVRASTRRAIYKGEHMKSPDVQHFRCDRDKIELREPRP